MGIRWYIFWATVSFLILIGVQWHLIYNTYILKDRDFNTAEKQLLNDAYGANIPDDKLYPGAGRIIDSLLEADQKSIFSSYQRGAESFKQQAAESSQKILATLRTHQVMDSVFKVMLQQLGLNKNLQYLLTLQAIELNFEDGKPNQFLLNGSQSAYPIAGQLKSPKAANRVTHLAVSGQNVFAYRITFNLFVDRPDRAWQVAKEMMPTFVLVVICMLILMAINYYSYHHWRQQKTEAEAKTDFLNSITHEFNTPITTIKVASKSLVEDSISEDTQKVKGIADIIARQAQKLETHIAQILNLSHLQSVTSYTTINLNDALKELVNDYQIKLQDHEHLSFGMSMQNPLVQADLFILQRILNNLIDNSLKYNHKSEKWTRITLNTQDDLIVIKVMDNGHGIDKTEQAKVFEKFYRPASSKAIMGLGLGLYYVKSAVAEMGWTLSLESELGKGSVFSIYIPKKSALHG